MKVGFVDRPRYLNTRVERLETDQLAFNLPSNSETEVSGYIHFLHIDNFCAEVVVNVAMASTNHAAPNSIEEPETPFPATTKRVTGTVKGVNTAVATVSFASTILITISQNDRVSHWVCCLL